MSQSDKPFSVNDRRHFTPEGQPRDDEPATESAVPGAPADESSAGPRETPGDGGETRKRARAGGAVDFGQFLVSLGAQAGMLLSPAGEAEGGETADALEGARSIISILEMLRDKTEGRRTPDEERVLDGLLYELRLAYVERSRAGKA
jgi:hypothetical protein